jgi:DNA topoisomerase-2
MAHKEGKKLNVYLNGKKLPVKDFKSYLGLFDGITPPAAYEKVSDKWEVGVGVSDSGSFQQISFVNAIATTKGGGHVNYIADQVAKRLQAAVKKKNKGGTEVKPNQIKNHLAIFVNCLVENPTFDSQTKENMTIRPSTFTSVKLSDKFMKQVEKSGVVDSIMSYAKFKQNQALKRKGGTKKTKLTGITKLDDANFAGTAKSRDCTLIITEGDSAKSLAVSGLSVVGRDYYGVFPLKGKLLNVRDATHAQIMKNEEIMNLVEIMVSR